MEDLNARNRRQYLRFRPNPEEISDLQQRSMEALAHIDPDASNDEFKPVMLGLLGDQSHTGCSVAFLQKQANGDLLQKDRECLVKAGALHPMRAVVRWRTDMDEHFFKVGFEFLD